MTFNEFNEIILKDVELQKKYDAEKETLAKEGSIKDKFELLSKAATKLGFDVPASEFGLKKIGTKELSDDELDAVTGGKCGAKCWGDFEDTDCFRNDFCNFMYNEYVLKTCLYEHDGYCTNSDACINWYIKYICKGDYTF